MQVSYSKKFLKQLAGVPVGTREKVEEFVFNQLVLASSIVEIGKIEKMQAYDGFYNAQKRNL